MKNTSASSKSSPKRKPPAVAERAEATPTPPAIPHDLESSVPYLLARAGMRTGQAFTLELRQFGLTLNDWRVCASLRSNPHQRLMDLAHKTSADASTLSRVVDGLLQRGLLTRERSSEDARAVALRLTPDGESLMEKIIPLAQLYERVALAGIDTDQAQLLREMLRRIYDNMSMIERK
jgi:MarR family transcriptional regulator, organic hydroperoxide resistance regulator